VERSSRRDGEEHEGGAIPQESDGVTSDRDEPPRLEGRRTESVLFMDFPSRGRISNAPATAPSV
jgi:hypothetical protein